MFAFDACKQFGNFIVTETVAKTERLRLGAVWLRFGVNFDFAAILGTRKF
jgi:hypothetical protein